MPESSSWCEGKDRPRHATEPEEGQGACAPFTRLEADTSARANAANFAATTRSNQLFMERTTRTKIFTRRLNNRRLKPAETPRRSHGFGSDETRSKWASRPARRRDAPRIPA